MLEEIKSAVKKFGEAPYYKGYWYFIIHKEFVEEIRKWLNKYIHTAEGDWLDYSIEQAQNEEFMYVLILYPSW